jgi:hypothetical protein
MKFEKRKVKKFCCLCLIRLCASRPAFDFESVFSQCGQGHGPTSRSARAATRGARTLAIAEDWGIPYLG